MQPALTDCLAPAKLNLFLHVTGRRADGYHLLQSAFQLIDLTDRLHFTRRDDGQIVRANALAGVPPEHDLTVRAARLLQAEAAAQGKTKFGVEITLEKSIPMGGGLGGGSSDAATTMLALNRLWELHWPRSVLARLGLQLGADVPFFIFGRNAFAEGIGEELTTLMTPECCFAVIHPGVSVPTASIFGAAELTRDTKHIKISDFSAIAIVETAADSAEHGKNGIAEKSSGKSADGSAPGRYVWPYGHNDLEPVATARFPEVKRALEWLGRFGTARMSGSGACVFCPFASAAEAQRAVRDLPANWTGWVCSTLAEHPLRNWADESMQKSAASNSK